MQVKSMFLILALTNNIHAHAAEEAPSLDLLEFLGSWETQEGNWIDPTQFVENPEWAEIEPDGNEEKTHE